MEPVARKTVAGHLRRHRVLVSDNKIVHITVVKGQSHGVPWQRTGHEVTNEFRQRQGLASAAHNVKLLLEVTGIRPNPNNRWARRRSGDT